MRGRLACIAHCAFCCWLPECCRSSFIGIKPVTGKVRRSPWGCISFGGSSRDWGRKRYLQRLTVAWRAFLPHSPIDMWRGQLEVHRCSCSMCAQPTFQTNDDARIGAADFRIYRKPCLGQHSFNPIVFSYLWQRNLGHEIHACPTQRGTHCLCTTSPQQTTRDAC